MAAVFDLQILSGVVQSTGWPGVVTVVGNWFGRRKRGTQRYYFKVTGVRGDLAKAFDCVNRDVLIEKLKYYEINETGIDWISPICTTEDKELTSVLMIKLLLGMRNSKVRGSTRVGFGASAF